VVNSTHLFKPGGSLLIILGGLPGTGKTSIARALAKAIGAMHVRIDTIEHQIWASGRVEGSLDDLGYRVAYAVCEDNLRLGLVVIADSVNPLTITRKAWRAVAERAGVRGFEVELVCSNPAMHRARVETRQSDISGFVLPTWQDVVDREYDPWNSQQLVIDTAQLTVDESVAAICAALPTK
jgi:predicted kinase